jgi:hypothetical protein
MVTITLLYTVLSRDIFILWIKSERDSEPYSSPYFSSGDVSFFLSFDIHYSLFDIQYSENLIIALTAPFTLKPLGRHALRKRSNALQGDDL